MKKNLRFFVIPAIISIFLLAGTTSNVTAVNYPYSVSIGDKIPYKVTILRNGTSVEPLFVKGLNLTEGDSFDMEIYDSSTVNPTSYWGLEFDVRFVKGDEKGIVFGAQSILFTSNKTFWDSYTNTSQDIGGTQYQVTIENNTGIFSWTTNADNIITVKFDTNNGQMTTFERKTTSSAFNYTHFKFEKGTASTPGFEIVIVLPAILFFTTIFMIRNKKKD